MRWALQICIIYYYNLFFIIQLPTSTADIVTDSYEGNQLEFSPFYDGIIFNDIAEIMNELDNNNANLPFSSDSESEEKIEDLLSEYQHYLDRAHKQKKKYEEKSKFKNKVPLLRQEKLSKINPTSISKYRQYHTLLPDKFRLPQKSSNSQIDLFIPLNPNFEYLSKPELSTSFFKGNYDENGRKDIDKKMINMHSLNPKLNYDPLISSCICKINQIPCDCKCKQCVYAIDQLPLKDGDQFKVLSLNDSRFPLTSTFLSDNSLIRNNDFDDVKLQDLTENDLNIKIKVDIQLPKILENVIKRSNRSIGKIRDVDENSLKDKKLQPMTSPISNMHFPIPIEFFELKKPLYRHDSTGLQKLTIHKKKKSKSINNGNKKHKKKIITFHGIKIEPQHIPNLKIEESPNNTNNSEATENKSLNQQMTNLSTTAVNINLTNNHSTVIANDAYIVTVKYNNSILQKQNITNSTLSRTEELHKIENSIETDYVKVNTTIDGPKLQRAKRDIFDSRNLDNNKENGSNTKIHEVKRKKDFLTNTQETSKNLNADADLLYWPNNMRNYTIKLSKNITAIILERENSKVKLNMSRETIRKNHTLVLEHAIFGDVDWNDVDTVAPVFMSFVGKYIRGILTFCSQKICHSMKCFEKRCVHRICTPEDRFNQRGHCIGSNTDSVATMESIMDLPSNIAFEIVDILQDKMLGKLFGKVTLCISSKCISLVAYKKHFFKSKCSIKDLNTTDHCPNLKHSKII